MSGFSTSPPERNSDLYRLVLDCLSRCRELAGLCGQNGWIDNDTLQFEIEHCDGTEARVAVRFTEVIMEGAGCVADRRERFGKLILEFDRDGTIRRCRVD